MSIEGATIFLRPIAEEDATEAYVSWMNDPEVVKYTESTSCDHTVDSLREYIRHRQECPDTYFFAIIRKNDNRHVGNIKLGPVNRRHGLADVGIIVGDRTCWGQGIGSDAIQTLCDWAFAELSLVKITAGVLDVNKGSFKAFRKAGFSVEAVLHRHAKGSDGSRHDAWLMALSAPKPATGGQTKCRDMQQRALARIPGMTQLLSKRPDMFSMGVWPGYYSRAEGGRVWDLDGNEYLDMSIAGIGACILGYADPDVDHAVLKAVSNGVASSLNCPEEVLLAEKLCELHPWADMARFSRTGGEALAIAVRIARAATGRDMVAFCGYHGWHDWYLAANLGTRDELGEHLIAGLNPTGVPNGLKGSAKPFRYNRLDELEAIADSCEGNLGVIVMEPIRNSRPDPGFIEGVRRIADRTGAVLVVDEVSAGFRLCTGGAHLKLFGIAPDMAVFSKALGNGYPVAAVIGKREVMQAAQSTFISSTNWTERTGYTAALATLAKHEKFKVHEKLGALGQAVTEGWEKIAAEHKLSIHTSGILPMTHFTLAHDDFPSLKALYIQEMLDRGILASNLYYAMYAHHENDVARYLDAAHEAFGVIAQALSEGSVKKRLRGSPAGTGFARLA